MKLCLITGATSGIGEGLAKRLAERNIPLILSGRNEEKLHELKNELKVPITIIPLELEKTREPLIKIIREQKPDLIINNAGFGTYGTITNQSITEQLDMIRVNCEALLEITMEAAKVLKEAKLPGIILNISSSASFQPIPKFATYSATKAFVTSFSESIHYELKPYGIKVLISCPGIVKTNFQVRASKNPDRKTDQSGTMTLDYALDRILSQIDHEKRVDIFNYRYKFFVTLGKFIPNSILAPMMLKYFRG